MINNLVQILDVLSDQDALKECSFLEAGCHFPTTAEEPAVDSENEWAETMVKDMSDTLVQLVAPTTKASILRKRPNSSAHNA